MTDVFEAVLTMSLTGSYVIAVVVILRWLLLRKLPKCYSLALWAVVLFRLLSPISFDSTASIVPQSVIPVSTVVLNGAEAAMPNISHTDVVIPTAAIAEITAPTAMTALSWVWAGGIVLLLCYSAVSCLRLHSKVAGAVHLESNIYQSTAINSPFVLGLVNPKIYLPPNIPPDEYGYILRHEQIHIRRLDYLTKPLAFLTLCLHWFNPLCWLAFVLFGRDMEMSCDERVIRELGDDIRLDYSDSLLAMASKGGFTGGGPLAFGESGVGQRIKNVLNFRRPAFWLTMVALLAVLIAVGGLATNPVEKRGIDPDGIPQPWTEPLSNQSQSEVLPEQDEPKLLDTGLSQEETAELKAQKDEFEAMTPREQALALEGGTIDCRKFEHLWWEESIDMSLIRDVGADNFDNWLKQRPEGQCASIYDFAQHFGLDYQAFAGLIAEYKIEDIYPPERVKQRFVYFGLPMDSSKPSAADNSVMALFNSDFLPLAQSGKGAYYNWKTNQVVGKELIDSFITAVTNKQAANLTYLVDSTYEPYVYVFTAKSGEELYTIDQYQPDGTKNSFRSGDAYKGETYYRFGYNLAGGRFPLYIPFGVDDPTRAAELRKLYENYLQVLTGAGMTYDYWSNPETISPESFMAYYVLTSDWWNKKEFDSTEKEVPGAQVESAILEHFDVPVRRLRAAVNYDETKQTYTFGIENYGYGAGDVRVTDYRREADRLTLCYEYYSPSDGTTIYRQGELEIQVSGEKYKYLSCNSWILG